MSKKRLPSVAEREGYAVVIPPKPRVLSPADVAEVAAAREAGRQALATAPRAMAARYVRRLKRVVCELANGATYAFPVALVEGLAGASDADLVEIELTGAGLGLRWPCLDVDLSVASLMMGRFGTEAWDRAIQAAATTLGRQGGAARTPAKAAAARANLAKAGAARSAAKAAAARANGQKGGRPRGTTRRSSGLG